MGQSYFLDFFCTKFDSNLHLFIGSMFLCYYVLLWLMLSVIFLSCRDGVWIFWAIGESSKGFKYPGRLFFVFMGLLSCCYVYCPYTERVNQ